MAAAVKAPSGRDIWKAVRDELMLNLYPLPFSTIAPTVYHVYLHPEDFDAIEGVAPRVVEQIQQALTAEVEKINEKLARSTRRVMSRLLEREQLPPIEFPPSGWEVQLCADPDGELERGQIGIVSTLAMPAPVEYAGTPTTRIVRSVVGGGGGQRRARRTRPARVLRYLRRRRQRRSALQPRTCGAVIPRAAQKGRGASKARGALKTKTPGTAASGRG